MISKELLAHGIMADTNQISTKSNVNPPDQTYTSKIKLLLQKNNETTKETHSLDIQSLQADSDLQIKKELPNVSRFSNSNYKTQRYDSKLTDSIYISSKSLNSLNKRRTSSSSSLSSNSGTSLSPGSNFNVDSNLKLLNPSKTSTPILLRNQLTKQQSFSPSIRSDTKLKSYSKLHFFLIILKILAHY